jgi:hypothetical protein
LTLVLLVATTNVECVFSAMNLVKGTLCNKMSDQWLNDRLVTYIEKYVFGTIDNDIILAHFKKWMIDGLHCNCINLIILYFIFSIL